MGDGRHGEGPGRASTTPLQDEVETVVGGASRSESVPPAGTNISRYVVLEEVGVGGMGRVLRAYDPKLQREVALKEVRGDALGAEGTKRLVAEARAMAKLSHPNVVGVYDVEEVESGELVLVMEYVAGETLEAWLGHGDHGWREIVGLFVAAGRGLIAAHEAGLLHRDFKPANVMVAASRTVKVTDFGLAKAAGEDVSLQADSVRSGPSEDGLTEDGVVMGTPRYMAPEQHRGEALTEAADQYAFCVALWEALCGSAPFSGRHLARTKQDGAPAWPNGGVPVPVARALSRGLSPAAADRWPSMESLLEALRWDPARRRNRWVLGLGGAGVLGLVGMTWHSWAAARASRCTGAEDQLTRVWDEARKVEVEQAFLRVDKPYATSAWERAERELDQHASQWTAMHTDACEATTVRGEQSAAVLDLRMACLHRASVDFGAVASLLADADAEVVSKADDVIGGLRPLSRCADVEALQADVSPPRPQDAEIVEAALSHLATARVISQAGRFKEAQSEVEAVKVILAQVDYGPARTELALAEGIALENLGDYAASERAFSDALRLASTLRQRAQMGEAAARLLYVVGYQQQRFDEALRYRELVEGLAEGDADLEVEMHNNLGAVLLAKGDYEEAKVEFRRVLTTTENTLGAEHPHAAIAHNNLAAILHGQGRMAQAEAEVRRAVTISEQALGGDHPDVMMSRGNLALLLSSQGKHEEALSEYRRVLVLREAALGRDHPSVASLRSNLGSNLNKLGRHEEAETEVRRALLVLESRLGSDHTNVASARNNLAAALAGQGKYKEAEAEQRRSTSLWENALGPQHPTVATARMRLADLLLQRGEVARARALVERALEEYIEPKAVDDDVTRDLNAWLGDHPVR